MAPIEIPERIQKHGIPAAEAERRNGLSKGMIRTWIRRRVYLKPDDYCKVGPVWYVVASAVSRVCRENGLGNRK